MNIIREQIYRESGSIWSKRKKPEEKINIEYRRLVNEFWNPVWVFCFAMWFICCRAENPGYFNRCCIWFGFTAGTAMVVTERNAGGRIDIWFAGGSHDYTNHSYNSDYETPKRILFFLSGILKYCSESCGRCQSLFFCISTGTGYHDWNYNRGWN